jgi:hypothetical protein
LLIVLQGCAQPASPKPVLRCDDLRVQDSLFKKYITNGAHQLPAMYNDTAWQLYCDSVLALCPGIAEIYQVKAVPYIKNGDHEWALALYDKTVQLDPKRYTGHRGFIKCLFTKDYEGALLICRRRNNWCPMGMIWTIRMLFMKGCVILSWEIM